MTSFSTGFLLSLLCGLWFYAYRTLFVTNLLEFYDMHTIGLRVTQLEYALSAIGLLTGAQLSAASWWTASLVLLANSLLLPWLVILLGEDVFMAPDYGILFFLPIWLSLRLFLSQVMGLLATAGFKHYRITMFSERQNF